MNSPTGASGDIFDPHQGSELFVHAWAPCGAVHFAGEHTSLKHAWIEGAVESGIRAAVEIVIDLVRRGTLSVTDFSNGLLALFGLKDLNTND